MARLLIVNADDFGLSSGVNEGIVEAHSRGVVTSTSLMVHRPGADEAAELAREYPSLSVGLHFDHEHAVDLDEPGQAARAFADQLQRFRELTGGEPTHVDSHHHFHATEKQMPVFSELVAPLGVPLRHDRRVPYLGGFWGQSEHGVAELTHVRRGFLVELISSEVGEGFTELGCHPARLTGDLRSSYLHEREVELQTLTEPGLRREIEAMGVELASFRDWPLRSRAA